MAAADKKTVDVKVWMDEKLELELRRLAEADDRKLSEYIALILRKHVYGHGVVAGADGQGPNRGD